MKSAIKAGLCYFLLVFAAAFVLGAVRTRLIEPNLGQMAGVAVELPVILAWCWIVCGWLVRGFRVPTRATARLTMGLLAFVLILVADAAIATIGLQRSLAQHLADYARPPLLLGLAAQLVFAAMPWLRSKIVKPRRSD